MNGKQISDDEFLHTVNVSFAVLADSVKTTKFQMLSLFPDKKVAALFQYLFFFMSYSLLSLTLLGNSS